LSNQDIVRALPASCNHNIVRDFVHTFSKEEEAWTPLQPNKHCVVRRFVVVCKATPGWRFVER
jgi:hypothetical protein